MTYTPYENTYTDPNKNNVPTYQGPSQNYQNLFNWVQGNMGGPSGMAGVLDKVRGTQASPWMKTLGVNPGQITQFALNKFSGKEANQAADAYRTGALNDVNQTFKKGYNDFRGQISGAGGRGSSGQARLMAEGMGQYNSARNKVGMDTENLRQQLKAQGFQQGMGTLNAWQQADQGDWQKALQSAGLALSSLSPELQAWQTGLGAAGGLMTGEQNNQNSMNQFNQQNWAQLFNKVKSGGFGQVAGALAPLLLAM